MALRECESDTIAAIATPIGEGGIGIVRVSGADAIQIVSKIFFPKAGQPIASMKSYTAALGQVRDEEGKLVDEGILLVMRAPKTYTTEDLVEIQLHGSGVVLAKTLELLIAGGARLAGKGEFTKRAFLNGRMDLMQAEAVLDLIQAKTDQGRRWALSQLEGALSKKIVEMKNDLLLVLSHLEAAIDFPDDQLDTQSHTEILQRLEDLRVRLEALLKNSAAGLLLKRGLRVALWGRPNAGKSSLMNCLAKHNRVIVAAVPGTTRDVVEEEIRIKDIPVRILDTAGIQETDNLIEKEGVRRSRQAAESADLVLFVADASVECVESDRSLFAEIERQKKIVVLNKADLPHRFDPASLGLDVSDTVVVKTSCVTEGGIDELETILLKQVLGGLLESSDEVLVSSVRQKDALDRTLSLVRQAIHSCEQKLSPELVAVDIRETLDCLGLLIGDIVTDDMLDVLFSQFCIGK